MSRTKKNKPGGGKRAAAQKAAAGGLIPKVDGGAVKKKSKKAKAKAKVNHGAQKGKDAIPAAEVDKNEVADEDVARIEQDDKGSE